MPFAKRTPSRASRSSEGASIPISEYMRSADHFIWSATMKITLGWVDSLKWNPFYVTSMRTTEFNFWALHRPNLSLAGVGQVRRA